MHPPSILKKYHRTVISLLVLLPVVVMFDVPIRNLIAGLEVPQVVSGILKDLGNGAVDLVLSLVLLAFHRRAGKAALVSFAAGGVSVNILKYLIGRARPYAASSAWVLVGPTVDGRFGSFPSGHSTTAFALASVAAAFYPRWTGPFFGLATAVALDRVVVGMHWPSDVLGGAVLGMAIAAWWLNRQA